MKTLKVRPKIAIEPENYRGNYYESELTTYCSPVMDQTQPGD